MKDKPVILVVDDQPQNIELLEAYLVPQGYDIVKAANGEEALGKLSGHPIDLILLDVLMPGMDGFEVTRRVRQDDKIRLVPIILVTVLWETEDRVKGIEAGCNDFLLKPVDKTELLARVRSLLKVKAYNDLMSNYRTELESEVTRRTDELKHTLENLRQKITERKRAEEALRQSEAKYRSIFDNAAEGIFQSTPEGKFLTANPAMASILGFSSPEELIRECTDIARQSYVHPEQREEFKRLMEQQNKLFGFEYEVSRKDGSVAWVSETAQAFRDATGRIVRYDGILINITERKRMEDALRQSEEKYRGIFENVQDVYYEATVEGTILEVSPSIEVMSKGQYRRDDLIGKSIWDFYADIGERQALLDVLRERGRVTDFEITLKNRDGSLIPCSISSKIQFNDQGRPEKIIGSMRDVTERKQAEEELRENEAFLSTLMETASSAIFIYQDERFTFINRASEILTGYSRNELIGMRFLEIVHPDHREMIVQRGLARQRGDKLPERYEFRIVQKDGSVCWVDFTGGRIEWHGRPAAIGTAFDITESKCMQDQIRKDLIVKEVMLKEIHHRVRNNLNVIVSLLNLQSDLITTKRQALKAFEETKNRIYAMALVHSNLYKEEDFSRVDLLSFIQNLTQNLMQVYNTDVKIDVHIEDLSLDLNNAVPCGLILNELVTNALKYAFKDKHKGLITIEFRMQKDNTCELTVQDNGAGLPEDLDIPKTKSLGLLIVNQLVDQIDGVLKITRGKGAKFQITFPVSAT